MFEALNQLSYNEIDVTSINKIRKPYKLDRVFESDIMESKTAIKSDIADDIRFLKDKDKQNMEDGSVGFNLKCHH